MRNLILLVVILFFASCKKQELPYPIKPIQCWQKFVGNYIVYDTAVGISFPMTIVHILDTNSAGYIMDYLEFQNFDNRFTFSHQFGCSVPSNALDIGFNVNVANYSNNHYNIWDEYDDTATLGNDHLLSKDTLNLYFNIENTAYWVSEGVFYENSYKHQFAVKQH